VVIVVIACPFCVCAIADLAVAINDGKISDEAAMPVAEAGTARRDTLGCMGASIADITHLIFGWRFLRRL
jgi:hypothetical protein